MSKKNKTNNFAAFLASRTGRKFFNIFYSVGAAVVILGALAKINHYPGGTELLMIGMVTEAFVFLISAFDNSQVDYVEESASVGGGVTVVGGSGAIGEPSKGGVAISHTSTPSKGGSSQGGTSTIVVGGSGGGGQQGGTFVGTGVIGSGYTGSGDSQGTTVGTATGNVAQTAHQGGVVTGHVGSVGTGGHFVSGSGGGSSSGSGSGAVGTDATGSATNVGTGGNVVAGMGGGNYNSANLSPEYMQQMEDATKEMENFNKMMSSLSAADGGFVSNFEALNDNVKNINSVYESQLQSINAQIDTIKYINGSLDRMRAMYDNSLTDSAIFKSENEKMTRQIQELNRVYARLLQAMNAGGGGGYNQTGGGYNPPL